MIGFLLVAHALAADPPDGRAVYTANCTACHGSAGDGKGPAAIALQPKPTDFTQPAYWASRTDAQISAAIRSGRPGTAMTPFTQLSDAEVASVVTYLRSLQKAPQ